MISKENNFKITIHNIVSAGINILSIFLSKAFEIDLWYVIGTVAGVQILAAIFKINPIFSVLDKLLPSSEPIQSSQL